MNYCEIKNTLKGQTLQKMSGLSEFSVVSFIKGFYNLFGRFPELDEIPNVNSEPYLINQLNIQENKGTNYSSTLIILDNTIAKSIDEARAQINREHPDLLVDIHELGAASIVDITHRPSEYTSLESTKKDINFDRTNNSTILINALSNLQHFYGINIKPITSTEVPAEFSESKGFIYQGQIYINIDKASVDTPIHELLHLFLGSIRFSNPNLYFQLVQSTQQLPNFNLLAEEFPNRTSTDVQEEIFVEQLGRYITNQSSLFDSIDPSITNLVMYYIKRDIDSILMGELSVKSLTSVFDKSLLDLALELNSDNLDIDTVATLNDAMIHRIMSNTKSSLMLNNELIQECV